MNLLAECARRLPSAHFAYFADNFNMPYGNLTDLELIERVGGRFEEIARMKPCAAVIACNTATAVCAGYLRQKYSFPIIGIEPAVKPAAILCKHVTVLCTAATANSAAVCRLVGKYGGGKTEVVACPNLAEYIENNIFAISRAEVEKMLPERETDGVVVGCTHYSYVKDVIANFYGCKVFDGLQGTATALCNILPENESVGGGNAREIVFCGGDESKNRKVFSQIFP